MYLICLDEPLEPTGNQHYAGTCESLDARMARQAAGRGSAFMREVERRGIGWAVVAVWEGGRRHEAWLKEQHNLRRYCPVHGTRTLTALRELSEARMERRRQRAFARKAARQPAGGLAGT